MTAEPRLCTTCGLPLAYSGKGRPRVAHPGSCTRDHRTRTDEARRWDRYEEVLRDAAVRAPLPGPDGVLGDHDDAPETAQGTLSRLADAGFAPLYDDPRERVPKRERARTAHRDAVLASLMAPTLQEPPVDVEEALPACWGCPALVHVAGVRAVFTAETLSHLFAVADRYGDDRRLRAHLTEDAPAALMARRPE